MKYYLLTLILFLSACASFTKNESDLRGKGVTREMASLAVAAAAKQALHESSRHTKPLKDHSYATGLITTTRVSLPPEKKVTESTTLPNNANQYLDNVSQVIESLLAFPKQEFSIPEPVLFELKGDYSHFPAGAIASELLSTLQENQHLYFELDFPQWLKANEMLFRLDDHISANAEYGNALIKTYLNSLWLTSGYAWLNGDAIEKQFSRKFEINRFIQQWRQIRFHLVDIETISYIYHKDILKTIFDTTTSLETELKRRTLSASLKSYNDHQRRLVISLAEDLRSISEEKIKEHRNIFPSDKLYQKLLSDQLFRDDYILRQRNNKYSERFRKIKAQRLKNEGLIEQVSSYLDMPYHYMILAPAGNRLGIGRLYKSYLNLLIKAQSLSELGLSFQDWLNLDHKIYIKYCMQDSWCPLDDIKQIKKRRKILNYGILLGTLDDEAIGLILLLKNWKTNVKDKKNG